MKYPINAYRYTTSTYKPMECLNIDFIGPFPDKGYILVMIDTFSRFVELYATPDATAKSACTALIEEGDTADRVYFNQIMDPTSQATSSMNL